MRKRNSDWIDNCVEGLYREGEEEIAKYEMFSYWYAVFKLKNRFRIGEKAIKESGYYWNKYMEYLKSKGIGI